MTGHKAKAAPHVPIAVSAPELWKLEFQRRAPVPGETLDADELSINTSIGVTRIGLTEIGVEFGLEIPDMIVGHLTVAYRAQFKLSATEQVDDIETALQDIAARIGPATLYPFIRESVATTLAKAGSPPLILPILNFGEMFAPAEMEIPAFEE